MHIFTLDALTYIPCMHSGWFIGQFCSVAMLKHANIEGTRARRNFGHEGMRRLKGTQGTQGMRFNRLINDGVEDTEHFFLHCHSYHLQRNSLLSRVQAILLSYRLLNLSNEELVLIILYGDERLPIESNKAIIKATPEFIESSKRFP